MTNAADLTPYERLILMSLRLTPNQDADELIASTGSQSPNYFRRGLRTLIYRGSIVATEDASVKRYSLTAVAQ